MRVISISSKRHLGSFHFSFVFLMSLGSVKIKLPLNVMLCKKFMDLLFFLIFYSHFETPTKIEKLSESIFPGFPLQTMNLCRLVNYSSRL